MEILFRSPPLSRAIGTASRHIRRISDVSRQEKRVQVYISRTTNPQLNLSIEHHLLKRSHPDSVILFLYTNSPCVVIGRNQNPWREVNLGLLRQSGGRLDDEGTAPSHSTPASQRPSEAVQLIRRHSGGGTVFHDLGNVNYSVLVPPAKFDRDRHALMVVRALRARGVQGVRVNERHDIVMDVDDVGGGGGAEGGKVKTFKISGSAYKLTRLRALHHGTCLLSSPNLAGIGAYLHSPALPYISARGTESYRSAIRNVGDVDGEQFEQAVLDEFREMYGDPDAEATVGDEVMDIIEIRANYEELLSPQWIYGQTPQFTFSTHPVESESKTRLPLPADIPPDFSMSLTVRKGKIEDSAISGLVDNTWTGRSLHEILDWREELASVERVSKAASAAGTWLNGMFGYAA